MERGPERDLDAPQAQKWSGPVPLPEERLLPRVTAAPNMLSHVLSLHAPACAFNHAFSHCGCLLGLPECRAPAFLATSVSLPSPPDCPGSESPFGKAVEAFASADWNPVFICSLHLRFDLFHKIK